MKKSYADRNRLGNMHTCASNRRRAPYGLDHVLRWHEDFMEHLVSLRDGANSLSICTAFDSENA